MQAKENTTERSKVKIEIILLRGIVERLKVRAAREGKEITSIIEDAILKSETEDKFARHIRLNALEKLFSIRFNISNKDWKTIMVEDYYEQ
jgi:hypothetical protein